MLLPEGDRQLKHVGYLLVLDMCGESRALRERRENNIQKCGANHILPVIDIKYLVCLLWGLGLHMLRSGPNLWSKKTIYNLFDWTCLYLLYICLQKWPTSSWKITVQFLLWVCVTEWMPISMQAFQFPYTTFCLTCEVAEDTEGEGEAGGVSRLQGRLRVT